MRTNESSLKGRILDADLCDEIQEVINAEGLEIIAGEIGVSALTLAKAASGFPVGAGTILDIQDFLDELDDEESDEAEPEDGYSDDETYEDGN